MASAKSGYVNGSDLLLMVAGKCIGHCSTHDLTYDSETKERAVKPEASKAVGTAGLWKNKTVTGLSVSISAEGYRHYDENESGFKELLAAWAAGSSVAVKAFERESDSDPYCSGSFVITSLKESEAAEDDATFTVSLENDGEVTINTDALTEN